MDTSTDREGIPKLDEPELIQTSETRITKFAAPLIGVVTLAVATLIPITGLGNLPSYDDLPPRAQASVGLGMLLVLASIILGVAVIAASDVRARGQATAANFALRARPPIVLAPPGAAGTSPSLQVTRAGYGSDNPWTVIDAQQNGGRTSFLIARGTDEPVWIDWAKVTGWSVKH